MAGRNCNAHGKLVFAFGTSQPRVKSIRVALSSTLHGIQIAHAVVDGLHRHAEIGVGHAADLKRARGEWRGAPLLMLAALVTAQRKAERRPIAEGRGLRRLLRRLPCAASGGASPAHRDSSSVAG